MKKDNPLIPDMFFPTLCDVDFDELFQRGYGNVILDVDNTIACGSREEAEEAQAAVIRGLLKRDPPFSICLVSNIIIGKKREERVRKIARSLEVPFVIANFFDRKPHPRPFLKALEILKSTPENTAVIGDQMFTDILGGNRLGMLTLMVRPLGPDHWATVFFGRRKKEKAILEKMGVYREK